MTSLIFLPVERDIILKIPIVSFKNIFSSCEGIEGKLISQFPLVDSGLKKQCCNKPGSNNTKVS